MIKKSVDGKIENISYVIIMLSLNIVLKLVILISKKIYLK